VYGGLWWLEMLQLLKTRNAFDGSGRDDRGIGKKATWFTKRSENCTAGNVILPAYGVMPVSLSAQLVGYSVQVLN
jgi:hypothetical protein